MIEHWQGAQWVLACLLVVGLILSASSHGEWKQQSFFASVIATALTVAILWWGGFWS